MTPTPRNLNATKNLREGIRKMESNMSVAAQVRREFRLGRPPKAVEEVEPMHRTVVWKKATDALSNFRERMVAATLNPAHVDARIVYVTLAKPDTPLQLQIDGPPKDAEVWKQEALETLGADDVLALGMIFLQYDAAAEHQSIFPYQFTGLSERGQAVLRRAAMDQNEGIAITKAAH
jgi:hypothetical protein